MEHDAGQGEHTPAQQNGAYPSTSGALSHPEVEAAQGAARAHAGMAAARSTEETLKKDEERPAIEDDEERPTVEHRAWLRHDDYWKRTTYVAITGRLSATAPQSRALPRPSRFHKPTPVRSSLVLLLIIALIVLIPIGVVVAQREAEAHIKLPSSIPGITLPWAATPTATQAATPTATPKKKK